MQNRQNAQAKNGSKHCCQSNISGDPNTRMSPLYYFALKYASDFIDVYSAHRYPNIENISNDSVSNWLDAVNTDERIFIEWENARCQSGKVVFGDDRRITMNNAKADEAISANSHSLTKEVTSADNIMSDDIIPLFRTKYLQDGIDKYVKIKIPVRFADGTVEEYDFYVRLYWEPETLK